MAQFDALLAILEPHIKEKATDFCELSVQGSIYSALCCETKWMNLTITILDFGVRFYGGSERSKHLKMLATDAKNAKNRTWSEFFYDGRKFRTQCAMTFRVKKEIRKIILIQRLNKIIFLAPLADIIACFKQKLIHFLYFLQKTRVNILNHFTCTVNSSWFKNV